jgi:hypothetical protein
MVEQIMSSCPVCGLPDTTQAAKEPRHSVASIAGMTWVAGLQDLSKRAASLRPGQR